MVILYDPDMGGSGITNALHCLKPVVRGVTRCHEAKPLEAKSFLALGCPILFGSLAVLDPRVGHTMDALSPFISVLCHSD